MRTYVKHRELYSMLCGNLNGKEIWKRWDRGIYPLGEGIAAHSSVLAWRIPWTEEPGGIQSMGSQRVRHG